MSISVPLPHCFYSNSNLRYLPLLVETSHERKYDCPHWHDFVQIWYVLSGTMKQVVSDKEYIQTPGSCIVISPYTVHSIDTRDSIEQPFILSLSFTDRFLFDAGYNFFSSFDKCTHFEGQRIPMFTEFHGKQRVSSDALINALMDEFNKHKNMSFAALAMHLSAFLSLLCLNTSATQEITDTAQLKEQAALILKSVHYMLEHLPDKLTLDKLASIATMSRSHFSRNFKAVTGQTPIEFLTSLRIQEAIKILAYSDKTTETAAHEVGLTHKSHLARVFREKFGIPPTEYLREMREYLSSTDDSYRKRWEWFNENDFISQTSSPSKK